MGNAAIYILCSIDPSRYHRFIACVAVLFYYTSSRSSAADVVINFDKTTRLEQGKLFRIATNECPYMTGVSINTTLVASTNWNSNRLGVCIKGASDLSSSYRNCEELVGGRNDLKFSKFYGWKSGATRVVGSTSLESYTFQCSYAPSDLEFRIYYGLLASTSYYSASYNIYSGSLTVHCATAVANPCLQTVLMYFYTGSMQVFQIPAAAKSLKIEAYGAQGGTVMNSGISLGGRGGYMSCSLEVSEIPSSILYVAVGGAGTGYSNTSQSNYGGWNGGGNSISTTTTSLDCRSGSGGGASDVRLMNLTAANSLDTRLVVGAGGGGGGGGGKNCSTIGGSGGGLIGISGTGYGGSPGGQGGGAGEGGAGEFPGGQDGLFGQGGEAVAAACLRGMCLGGGGGGGWYGGGGGYLGGGGGGSNYCAGQGSILNNVRGSQDSSGKIIITITSMNSMLPTQLPTCRPSSQPTSQPINKPSMEPQSNPTFQPFHLPTGIPSSAPSSQPSDQPTFNPSKRLVPKPSSIPSGQPSRQPSTTQPRLPPLQVLLQPTSRPTMQPTIKPTQKPSNQPSRQPSGQPSSYPTFLPSITPAIKPTYISLCHPSMQPSQQPSQQPSMLSSFSPSRNPTVDTWSEVAALKSNMLRTRNTLISPYLYAALFLVWLVSSFVLLLIYNRVISSCQIQAKERSKLSPNLNRTDAAFYRSIEPLSFPMPSTILDCSGIIQGIAASTFGSSRVVGINRRALETSKDDLGMIIAHSGLRSILQHHHYGYIAYSIIELEQAADAFYDTSLMLSIEEQRRLQDKERSYSPKEEHLEEPKQHRHHNQRNRQQLSHQHPEPSCAVVPDSTSDVSSYLQPRFSGYRMSAHLLRLVTRMAFASTLLAYLYELQYPRDMFPTDLSRTEQHCARFYVSRSDCESQSRNFISRHSMCAWKVFEKSDRHVDGGECLPAEYSQTTFVLLMLVLLAAFISAPALVVIDWLMDRVIFLSDHLHSNTRYETYYRERLQHLRKEGAQNAGYLGNPGNTSKSLMSLAISPLERDEDILLPEMSTSELITSHRDFSKALLLACEDNGFNLSVGGDHRDRAAYLIDDKTIKGSSDGSKSRSADVMKKLGKSKLKSAIQQISSTKSSRVMPSASIVSCKATVGYSTSIETDFHLLTSRVIEMLHEHRITLSRDDLIAFDRQWNINSNFTGEATNAADHSSNQLFCDTSIYINRLIHAAHDHFKRTLENMVPDSDTSWIGSNLLSNFALDLLGRNSVECRAILMRRRSDISILQTRNTSSGWRSFSSLACILAINSACIVTTYNIVDADESLSMPWRLGWLTSCLAYLFLDVVLFETITIYIVDVFIFHCMTFGAVSKVQEIMITVLIDWIMSFPISIDGPIMDAHSPFKSAIMGQYVGHNYSRNRQSPLGDRRVVPTPNDGCLNDDNIASPGDLRSPIDFVYTSARLARALPSIFESSLISNYSSCWLTPRVVEKSRVRRIPLLSWFVCQSNGVQKRSIQCLYTGIAFLVGFGVCKGSESEVAGFVSMIVALICPAIYLLWFSISTMIHSYGVCRSRPTVKVDIDLLSIGLALEVDIMRHLDNLMDEFIITKRTNAFNFIVDTSTGRTISTASLLESLIIREENHIQAIVFQACLRNQISEQMVARAVQNVLKKFRRKVFDYEHICGEALVGFFSISTSEDETIRKMRQVVETVVEEALTGAASVFGSLMAISIDIRDTKSGEFSEDAWLDHEDHLLASENIIARIFDNTVSRLQSLIVNIGTGTVLENVDADVDDMLSSMLDSAMNTLLIVQLKDLARDVFHSDFYEDQSMMSLRLPKAVESRYQARYSLLLSHISVVKSKSMEHFKSIMRSLRDFPARKRFQSAARRVSMITRLASSASKERRNRMDRDRININLNEDDGDVSDEDFSDDNSAETSVRFEDSNNRIEQKTRTRA